MCIFCDIIEGKIPSKKLYEDDDILAILDISQTTKGHSLVMPKKHYDNFLAMPNKEFSNLMSKVQELALQIKTNSKCTGINILINTGKSAGQSVEHIHVHIIPRYDENDSINIEFKENAYDLDEVLKTLKGA